jgi:hypothetical protein
MSSITLEKNATSEIANKEGIYRVEIEDNADAVNIKCLGMLEESKLMDTFLKPYDIKKDVYGEIYLCNVTGKFLMSTKRLPVLCTKIIYSKTVTRHHLLAICLLFNINSDIKSVNDLLGIRLRGTYSVEINIDGQIREISADELDSGNFSTNDEIIKQMIKFTKSKSMNIIIDDILKIKEDDKIKQFGNFYHEVATEIPVPTISFKNLDSIKQRIEAANNRPIIKKRKPKNI